MTRNTEVLYNARCPVCRAEIAHYEAYAAQRDLPIRFIDLHTDDTARWGLTPDQAAKRLHVRHEGGILSGVDAFVHLWAQMPRYRTLARIVGVPGLRHAAAFVYNRILAPWLYARHRRRMARAPG